MENSNLEECVKQLESRVKYLEYLYTLPHAKQEQKSSDGQLKSDDTKHDYVVGQVLSFADDLELDYVRLSNCSDSFFDGKLVSTSILSRIKNGRLSPKGEGAALGDIVRFDVSEYKKYFEFSDDEKIILGTVDSKYHYLVRDKDGESLCLFEDKPSLNGRWWSCNSGEWTWFKMFGDHFECITADDAPCKFRDFI